MIVMLFVLGNIAAHQDRAATATAPTAAARRTLAGLGIAAVAAGTAAQTGNTAISK